MPNFSAKNIPIGAKMVYNGISKGVNTLTNVANTAGKAYKIASTIAKMVNAEKKYFDVSFSNTTNFDNNGACFCLSAMAQGTDYNTRIGNSIKAASDQWRFNLLIGAATNVIYRVIFFTDRENRQANPAVTDVLESASTVSPLNHINGKRFHIIKDYYGELDTVKSPIKCISHYHKMKGHIKFTAAAAGVASADEGNLFVLILSSNAVATAPSITITNRLRFYDN